MYYNNNNNYKYKTKLKENKYNYNYTDFKNILCANCGEMGHIVRNCNGAITSFGNLAFKINYSEKDDKFDLNDDLKCILRDCNLEKEEYPKIKFLLMQRKDTMGLIDFLRGKYPNDPIEKEKKIKNCFNEMTSTDKIMLEHWDFDKLWDYVWVSKTSKCYLNEKNNAKRKFEMHDIKELIKQSTNTFSFTEFSIPKGRRNMKEDILSCAEREFEEETGFNKNHYEYITNYPTIQ